MVKAKNKNLTFFKDKLIKNSKWQKMKCNYKWNGTAKHIKVVVKYIFGECKVNIHSNKEFWWWNEDLQIIIKV